MRHPIPRSLPPLFCVLLAAGCAGATAGVAPAAPVESVPWNEPSPRVWIEEGRDAALAAAAHGYQPVAASRQAFGAFGMERFERHWQGVWLVGESAVWKVEGSRVTVHHPGAEPSAYLFEVESPCAVARVAISMEDGRYAGSSTSTTRFLIDGERTYAVGSAGLAIEDANGDPAVIVCHFGGTTTWVGEQCTSWESGRSGDTGGEQRFRRRERDCAIERAPDPAVEARRFRYEEGNFRTRKTIPIHGNQLEDAVNDARVEMVRFASLDDALAEMEARRRAVESDLRDRAAVEAAVRDALLDPARGGMVDDPWIGTDTGGRYTEVEIAGCTLSTTLETRLVSDGPAPLRVRTTIPLAAIASRPRPVPWTVRDGEATGSVGTALFAGEGVGAVEECRRDAGGEWRCAPLPEGVVAVVLRTRAAADQMARDLARAGEVCRK
jgi:hypothetical protein